jgi:hypothetical protein
MKAVGNRPRRMARREPEDRLECPPYGHMDFCHSSCQGPAMVREWDVRLRGPKACQVFDPPERP